MVVWIHVDNVKLIGQKLVAWYENFQVAVGVANWLRDKVGTEFKENWEEEKQSWWLYSETIQYFEDLMNHFF